MPEFKGILKTASYIIKKMTQSPWAFSEMFRHFSPWQVSDIQTHEG